MSEPTITTAADGRLSIHLPASPAPSYLVATEAIVGWVDKHNALLDQLAGKVARLELGPEDILVAKVEGAITAAEAAAFKEALAPFVPAHRVLVTSADVYTIGRLEVDTSRAREGLRALIAAARDEDAGAT